MKTLRIVTSLFLAFWLSHNTFAQSRWEKMKTVDEVLARYPGRIDTLFASLDLVRTGLEKVNAAIDKGDVRTACNELLSYYRTAETSKHLRRDQPSPATATDPGADSIVQHIFTFYDIRDKVPSTASGQLDWSHRGPDNDIEWAWGLNRHGHLHQLLETYFATGNPIYAKTIDEHIQDWVTSSLPYPRVKSATAMWRGLEVALRAKVWVHVFFALINSDQLTPATKLLMLSSLPEHTHYMRNFHAGAGNWLTMEMSGLAMVATAWPEFKGSAEWVAYAKTKMLEGLKDQVYPDGVQKELTSHYHVVALYNFDQFREICDQANEPLPADYTKELEKMHHYIASTVRPDGSGILNNDSDRRYNRDLILDAAAEYGREDWLFIATNGKRGKRPSGAPSVVFPWAGQLVMRSGYDVDAHWAFFDIGPWGTGHQHNDKLHLSISAYGRDLLVDGGRFAYRGALADKFRKYAVGSASHNVVLIDGNGQDAGPRVSSEPVNEKNYKITDRFDYAWSSFEQFKNVKGEAKHTRALFYVRGKFWIMADQIKTDRPRKVETLWHWHPGSQILEKNGVISTNNEKGNLKIIPLGFDNWKVDHIKGQEKPEPQGWYSERYNKAEPSVVSIYSADVNANSEFVWLLYPSEGKNEQIKAEILRRDDQSVTVKVSDAKLNQWEVTVPFSDSDRASYTFTSGKARQTQPGKSVGDPSAASVLLSRMDINAPGLEAVKASAHDPSKAAGELLTYYRSRSHVKHPVDRAERARAKGQYATGNEIQVADNAMQHVFIGQGAYPPYYCGDDINWRYRPVPDNEWVWQLNRMGFWEDMAKAYWHTGNEKYAEEWAMQLLDWTQKNPRDEAHAYAWRSIEAGIRGYRWMSLFHHFLDAEAFTADVLVAFLNSSYDHAEYLMTKYRKGSNWGLMEAEGMAFIAMTFPEFANAKEWRTEAVSRLNAEIENQVYSDGHQRELAMGYHMGSVGWFKRTLDLASMNGHRDVFPASYLQTIEKMCGVPFKLGFPDGTNPQFGDAWTGKPGHLWQRLQEWADVFDRDDFRYVATEGKKGKLPRQTAFALEESGLYSMRSGWDKDAVCLVLKCGPNGGGHSQPDNGTFELYAGGRHLMPDAGSYIYSGDPEGRAWFRQTKVHQTLTLNGENSAYAPKQLVWKPGKDLDVLVVENKSYPDLTHRRAVLFVNKKFFVIIDEASGPASGDVDLHFQLAPGEAVFDSANLSVQSDFQNGWNVLVQSAQPDGAQLQREEGWVSFVYTKKEPRPAFRYRMTKASPEGVRFVTIVAPYSGQKSPKINAEIIGSPGVGASKITLNVSGDWGSKKISYQIPRQ